MSFGDTEELVSNPGSARVNLALPVMVKVGDEVAMVVVSTGIVEVAVSLAGADGLCPKGVGIFQEGKTCGSVNERAVKSFPVVRGEAHVIHSVKAERAVLFEVGIG